MQQVLIVPELCLNCAQRDQQLDLMFVIETHVVGRISWRRYVEPLRGIWEKVEVVMKNISRIIYHEPIPMSQKKHENGEIISYSKANFNFVI